MLAALRTRSIFPPLTGGVGRCLFSKSSKKNAPALKHVLKKFFLKVHPDHFAQYPTIAKANEASFQELQSFLQHIAGANDGAMPPAKNTPLTFYAWAPEKHVSASSGAAPPAPKLRKIAVNLRTTGGDCRHLITKTLTDMFEQANVQPPAFSWGEAYWNDGNLPTLDELRQKMADEAEDSETEKKGFASEAEERAFYRSRSERQGGQSANKV